MLLHGDTPDTAERVGERIRRNIENSPLFIPGEKVPLTISIGIFNVSKGTAHLDCKAMFGRADDALYEAKSTGRNKVVMK